MFIAGIIMILLYTVKPNFFVVALLSLVGDSVEIKQIIAKANVKIDINFFI
ncbi:hypothetical protein P615_21980 [Brevibacillus laterosporus PE36]|nr:hypothetical protein P615_21980 [Brevibacillus laterosporus PE36]